MPVEAEYPILMFTEAHGPKCSVSPLIKYSSVTRVGSVTVYAPHHTNSKAAQGSEMLQWAHSQIVFCSLNLQCAIFNCTRTQ
jgi:hypothetical protein